STGSNLGYAGGMQWGIERALQADADFVWLLNNDSNPIPGSLGPLLQEMAQNPNTAACSGIIRHRREGWSHGGGSLDLIRGRLRNQYSELHQQAKRYKVDWVPGVAWLLRISVIQRIGGLDCRLFLYGEESDWCHRARSAGFDSVMVPAAELEALEGATT